MLIGSTPDRRHLRRGLPPAVRPARRHGPRRPLARCRHAGGVRLRHERHRLRRRGRRGAAARRRRDARRPARGALLAFAFAAEGVGKAVANRTAQCLLTCPTTAVFDGLPAAEERVPLGGHVRFFGDGFEKTKVVDGRRFWRVPVMDGEFLVEESAGVAKGVGGGNFILQGAHARGRARRGPAGGRRRSRPCPGMITPFPGGVVRSGSKVGSRYAGPAGLDERGLLPGARGPGGDRARRRRGLRPGDRDRRQSTSRRWPRRWRPASAAAAGPDVPAISAGNYGGKLGKFHFHLHQVLGSA